MINLKLYSSILLKSSCFVPLPLFMQISVFCIIFSDSSFLPYHLFRYFFWTNLLRSFIWLTMPSKVWFQATLSILLRPTLNFLYLFPLHLISLVKYPLYSHLYHFNFVCFMFILLNRYILRACTCSQCYFLTATNTSLKNHLLLESFTHKKCFY